MLTSSPALGTSPSIATETRSAATRSSRPSCARKLVGLTIAFHDLRHTGQSLAAATGASLVDLKKRLGHSSTEAAQRYRHAVEGRDAQIADALSRPAESGDASQLPKRF